MNCGQADALLICSMDNFILRSRENKKEVQCSGFCFDWPQGTLVGNEVIGYLENGPVSLEWVTVKTPGHDRMGATLEDLGKHCVGEQPNSETLKLTQ